MVKRDFFGLHTLIRQATVVSVTEADPEAVLPVPALICYTLRDGLVGSLQAVWEPRHVIAWFIKRKAAGLKALGRHGARPASCSSTRTVSGLISSIASCSRHVPPPTSTRSPTARCCTPAPPALPPSQKKKRRPPPCKREVHL